MHGGLSRGSTARAAGGKATYHPRGRGQPKSRRSRWGYGNPGPVSSRLMSRISRWDDGCIRGWHGADAFHPGDMSPKTAHIPLAPLILAARPIRRPARTWRHVASCQGARWPPTCGELSRHTHTSHATSQRHTAPSQAHGILLSGWWWACHALAREMNSLAGTLLPRAIHTARCHVVGKGRCASA